jgi:GcrA cell cycle regulator
MFIPERKSPPVAALPPSAATAPAAGVASIPDEALLMPAAPFSEASADKTQAVRQEEIGPEQCRWIIADEDAGADALMCGALAEPRRPFCAEHCARAYMKLEADEELVEDETDEDEEAERRLRNEL